MKFVIETIRTSTYRWEVEAKDKDEARTKIDADTLVSKKRDEYITVNEVK
jgi:hypothetical protein